MKTLEIRRHAKRDSTQDRLSPEGRAQAEEVGRGMTDTYDIVFVSPAARAAETVAWLLRGSGAQLPAHAVVPGLAGVDAPEPAGLAGMLQALLDDVPEGGRGLAVGHTPLIERGVGTLTGYELAPLAECEGVVISQTLDGAFAIEEIRSETGH